MWKDQYCLPFDSCMVAQSPEECTKLDGCTCDDCEDADAAGNETDTTEDTEEKFEREFECYPGIKMDEDLYGYGAGDGDVGRRLGRGRSRRAEADDKVPGVEDMMNKIGELLKGMTKEGGFLDCYYFNASSCEENSDRFVAGTALLVLHICTCPRVRTHDTRARFAAGSCVTTWSSEARHLHPSRHTLVFSAPFF